MEHKFRNSPARLMLMAIALVALGVAGVAGAAGQPRASKDVTRVVSPVHSGASRSVPVTALQFGATGVVTDAGPLLAAPGYGDSAHGRHGTLIKMPAKFVSPVHAHTEDYYAVVITGVMANGAPRADDVPLPPGSYWFQRGEEMHVTKCISQTECLFMTSQAGRFDFLFPEHSR